MRKNILPFLSIVILLFIQCILIEGFTWIQIPRAIIAALVLAYVFKRCSTKESDLLFGNLSHYIAIGIMTLVLVGIGILAYGINLFHLSMIAYISLLIIVPSCYYLLSQLHFEE